MISNRGEILREAEREREREREKETETSAKFSLGLKPLNTPGPKENRNH